MDELRVGRIEQLTNDARTPEWKETLGNLSISRRDAKDDLCQACRVRPATLNWIGEGGSLAMSHGLYQRWCEFCAVSAQVAYARKILAGLPDLEARLAELSGAPPSINAVDPVPGVVAEVRRATDDSSSLPASSAAPHPARTEES